MSAKPCSVCEVAVAIAKGMCRRCYDRTPERRAARQQWQRSNVAWRRNGLAVDPLEGWAGAHGLAVHARTGWCAYRRRSRQDPTIIEVRRPGHPLAGKTGWLQERRMIAYDAWVAEGKPAMRCVWCRTPLVWRHRARQRRKNAPHVAHVVLVDKTGCWDRPIDLGLACWPCAWPVLYGLDS